MTILPDAIDEATGQRIDGSAQVKQTKGMGFDDIEEIDSESQEALTHQVQQEDPSDPNYVPEAVRISDTFDSVMQNDTVCADPELGQAVLSVDLGDSPAATVVQHLAYRYTQGESPESLFQEAVATGVDSEALMQAYWTLVEAFDHG